MSPLFFHSIKKNAVNLVCLSLAVVLSLGLLELGLRHPRLRPSFRMEGLVFELDGGLLYKMRPYSRKDLNRWGYRGADWKKHPESGKKRILFLGDSFVFGVNVDIENSLPVKLQEKLGENYEVLNLGVQGYGPDQSLRQLEKQGLGFKPDAVVLALYPANDFNDITRNRMYRYDSVHKRLIKMRTPVEKLLGAPRLAVMANVLKRRFDRDAKSGDYYDPFNPESYRELFMDLFADYMDFDFIDNPGSAQAAEKKLLMQGILQEILRLCSAKGIPVYAVLIPSGENYGAMPLFDTIQLSRERYFANEEAAEDVCRLAGMPLMDLRDLFSSGDSAAAAGLYHQGDGHLSAQGYDAAAGFMAARLGAGAADSIKGQKL